MEPGPSGSQTFVSSCAWVQTSFEKTTCPKNENFHLEGGDFLTLFHDKFQGLAGQSYFYSPAFTLEQSQGRCPKSHEPRADVGARHADEGKHENLWSAYRLGI